MALPVTNGLVLYLSADSITGVADGASLSSWPDLSGLGNNATQTTVASQPIYKATGSNYGRPGVLFGSGSGIGMTTPVVLSVPYTVLAYYSAADINTSRRAVQLSKNGTNWLLGPRRDANNSFAFYDNGFINGPAFVANQAQCSVASHAASGASFYVNGALQGTNTQTTVTGTFLLGAAAAGWNEPLNGFINAVAVYNRALSATEVSQISSYVITEYGPQAGVNVSKANVYAVLEKPLALNVSKANAYVVLEKPLALNVSKANVYAVLTPLNSNPPIWPNFTFADGVVGNTYSQQWDLTPAAAPTTYTLYSGTLPPGLSISNVGADVGKLSGIPTTAGTYTFQILATNSVSAVPSGTFSMNISAASSGGQVAHAFIGL